MILALALRHRLGAFALDVDFKIERPGITALFGPSGAGKTTIVNAIAGLLRPQAGRIAIDSDVLFDSKRGVNLPARQRRIGYVFQDARLFPHLDVRDNLLFGARRCAAGRTAAPFDAIVSLLGIAAILDRRPRHLSGGERQRIALGRALLAEPRLLLLDEPLSGLDQGRRAEIMPYLERLRDEAGIPMLYVSHAVDEVARLADHMVVLDSGRVVASGSVFDLMARLDLFPLTGPIEAGAVFEARIETHDLQDQMTALTFDGGRFWVPGIEGSIGATVRVRIRARDVMLALEKPHSISANNVLRGTVTEIRPDSSPHIDVQIACGGTLLIARITRRSLERLGLQPGTALYAVIKSVTIDRRSLATDRATDIS
ncbi:MAG: molybdenum ABC transporter ATP-binding protein [Rhodospirillaceae bacterium]|nr:molybdenum ABC transporter ATP-binding protein [Rhodospirillaceae bacterium]